MKKPKPILLKVPSDFDSFATASKYRKRLDDQQLLSDRLSWVLHLLITKPLKQKDRKAFDERGFTSLHTEVFLDFFRTESLTKEVFSILQHEGWIEIDESYSVGNYSKGYRLSTLVCDSKTIIAKSKTFKKYFDSYNKKVEKEQKHLIAPILPLIENIKDPKLTIDLKAAHSFIEHWSFELHKRIHNNKEDLPQSILKELTKGVHSKIFYSKEAAKQVADPESRYFIRDATGLRLHSSFTGLKAPLRNFLLYNNKTLVSIDIKASQPYFLTKLISKEFWEKTDNHNLSHIHPQLLKHLSSQRKPTTKPKTNDKHRVIMSVPNSTTYSEPGVCGYDYLNIPWRKDFYTMFENEVKTHYSNDPSILKAFSNRARTKFHMMLLFFNPGGHNHAYTKPFRQFFPETYKFMAFVRSLPGFVYKTSSVSDAKQAQGNKNNLPVLLQRIEAIYLLEHICAGLHNDYPDLFLLTIHDSIITTKEDSPHVKKYMEKMLTAMVGSKPGLKVEALDGQKTLRNIDAFFEEEWIDLIERCKKRVRSKKQANQLDRLYETLQKKGSSPLLTERPTLPDGREIFSAKYLPASSDE